MFVAAMSALYQAIGMKYIDSKAKSTMPETLMLKRERKSLDTCHYGHIATCMADIMLSVTKVRIQLRSFSK